MPQTINDLGRMVKAKYPDYADIDEAEVGRRVKAKFPQDYSDFMDVPMGSHAPIPAGLQGPPESSYRGPAIPAITHEGSQQLWKGLTDASQPAPDRAADVIEGIGKGTSPALIPAAIANPVGTLGAVGLGTAGYGAGRAGSAFMHVSPGASRLMGDIGGVLGGAAGSTPTASRLLSSPDVWEAAGNLIPLLRMGTRIREFGSAIGNVIHPPGPTPQSEWRSLPLPSPGKAPEMESPFQTQWKSLPLPPPGSPAPPPENPFQTQWSSLPLPTPKPQAAPESPYQTRWESLPLPAPKAKATPTPKSIPIPPLKSSPPGTYGSTTPPPAPPPPTPLPSVGAGNVGLGPSLTTPPGLPVLGPPSTIKPQPTLQSAPSGFAIAKPGAVKPLTEAKPVEPIPPVNPAEKVTPNGAKEFLQQTAKDYNVNEEFIRNVSKSLFKTRAYEDLTPTQLGKITDFLENYKQDFAPKKPKK